MQPWMRWNCKSTIVQIVSQNSNISTEALTPWDTTYDVQQLRNLSSKKKKKEKELPSVH